MKERERERAWSRDGVMGSASQLKKACQAQGCFLHIAEEKAEGLDTHTKEMVDVLG